LAAAGKATMRDSCPLSTETVFQHSAILWDYILVGITAQKTSHYLTTNHTKSIYSSVFNYSI